MDGPANVDSFHTVRPSQRQHLKRQVAWGIVRVPAVREVHRVVFRGYPQTQARLRRQNHVYPAAREEGGKDG